MTRSPQSKFSFSSCISSFFLVYPLTSLNAACAAVRIVRSTRVRQLNFQSVVWIVTKLLITNKLFQYSRQPWWVLKSYNDWVSSWNSFQKISESTRLDCQEHVCLKNYKLKKIKNYTRGCNNLKPISEDKCSHRLEC